MTFLYAGTPAVLASLLKVADEPTAVLMQRFCANLKAGASKDVALQQAQVGFLRGPVTVGEGDNAEVRDLSHPYYWAAFVLHGDWR